VYQRKTDRQIKIGKVSMNGGKINWYPGHMKKTRDMIAENLKLVDAVIEVIDARIPASSRNPAIDDLTKNKRRIVVMNKSDLADPAQNKAWQTYFTESGLICVAADSMHGRGIRELTSVLASVEREMNEGRQRRKNLRLMVVGIPNAGKSSLINRLTGRKSARTGDRPGVTRGKQWVTISGGMQLLDTPGILWADIEDPEVGKKLAFCGSIKDEITDTDTLTLELIKVLGSEYPEELAARYKLDEISGDALLNMEAIAKKRGFILSGGRIDYSRCASTVLDEFRSGAIGRITLEKAPHTH